MQTQWDEKPYARKQAAVEQKDKVVMKQCFLIRIEEHYLYSYSKIKQTSEYENKNVYSPTETHKIFQDKKEQFFTQNMQGTLLTQRRHCKLTSYVLLN